MNPQRISSFYHIPSHQHQKPSLIKLIIKDSMSTDKANPFFRKKYAYDLSKDQSMQDRINTFQTPMKYNTIESNHNRKHQQFNLSNAKFSIQSSRIADETQQLTHKTLNYQDALREKIQYFEAETAKIIDKKEREIYFLTVELKNYEIRWKQAEDIGECQREEIQRLREQMQSILAKRQQASQNGQYYEGKINALAQENAKLKATIQSILRDRNQHRLQPQRQYASTHGSQHNFHFLKREVEELKMVISQMQYSIKNCSSCFTLKRQNQELSQAYHNLQKMYQQLNQNRKQHEKSLLDNITIKIQQNQNILRQNHQLRQQSNPKTQPQKSTRQKIKQSVAKRCRTLTDQF